ncbi:MAG: VCBS repeat-containing protein [Bacteroidetes bacterium]|nr:VCBS repeat-containing protein [Bacteroidota bacterium]
MAKTLLSRNYNPGWSTAVTTGDWDKDNDIDVLVSCPKTILYKNENGNLSQSNNEFFNINSGNINNFDFNNDTFLDLIFTGQDTNYTKQTLIYKNTGTGYFTEILPEVKAVTMGSLLTGDYNGDGNSDLVIAGLSNVYMLKVYENNGNEKLREVYTNQTIKPFPYSYNSIWTDYNGDGYLDILTSNNLLFSNNSNTVKLPPKAPKNLQTEILGFDVNFSWEKPSENSHYTYNLRVGTTPGGTEVVSPMADVLTGKRLILEKGNAQLNTGWTIKDLKAAQTYYWSVQAVDNGFKGGAWAPEKSFTMQTVYPDFVADTACNGYPTSFKDMSVSPLGNITNWKWDFGDKEVSLTKNPKHIYKNPGEYTVTLAVKKDSLTFSKTAKVLVKASPKAGFTSNSIAQNRTLVTFANTSDTGNIAVTKWLWDFGDGLSFTGRVPQPHGYSTNGLNTVSLVIESENGCSDTASSVLNICNETLEKPAIISRGPNVWYLQCSIETAKYYRWYLNDKIISEAKGYDYLANQKMGIYKVEISDKGECYIPSDEIKIPTGITGIEDSDPFEGVKIYPNPTPGLFTIEMDNNIFGELVIDIYNQIGSKALNIKFEKTTEHFQTQIDLSGQSKGMYLINLSLDEFRAVRKLLRSKN